MMKGRGIFKLYQDVLNRRPYFVQAIQTGTLMAAGDVISQTIIEKIPVKYIDYKRTLKFSSIGFFVGVSCFFVDTVMIINKKILYVLKKT